MGIGKPKPIARVLITDLQAKKGEQKTSHLTVYENSIKNAKQVKNKIEEALK